VIRSVVVGAAALPVLAACGTNSGDAQSPATAGSTPAGTSTPTGGSGGGGGAEVLAKTTDIKVGGAVFLNDGIVITQPTAGDFHAFNRTCTHQGCLVTDIRDGEIHCGCHGSLYDMTTGQNVGGPAPSPLAVVAISVKGTNITRA